MSSTSLSLRVAIVGAGPAGIYAGNLLANAVAAREGNGKVEIDLFESLPAPYGLIRYGVAPHHPPKKGIVKAQHEMRDAVPLPVIASGGVCTLEHVRRLIEERIPGCIIGRALYEGSLDLAAALALATGRTP